MNNITVKLPKTEEDTKYSWVRADVEDSTFDDTFDSIEECIEDAHDCWNRRVGHYETVDENGYDEITGFTVEYPIILIGKVKSMFDELNLKDLMTKIQMETKEAFSDSVYEVFNGNCYISETIRLKTNEEDYRNNLLAFIKNNFNINPDVVLKPFQLSYDLLSDKWIKQ